MLATSVLDTWKLDPSSRIRRKAFDLRARSSATIRSLATASAFDGGERAEQTS